jgi:hypothetical protein
MPGMKRYKNLAGDSGVTAYEIGSDSIDVQFGDEWVYTYTYESAEQSNLEHMKDLAVAGRGLSTFISTVVKDRYARKWKLRRARN